MDLIIPNGDYCKCGAVIDRDKCHFCWSEKCFSYLCNLCWNSISHGEHRRVCQEMQDNELEIEKTNRLDWEKKIADKNREGELSEPTKI